MQRARMSVFMSAMVGPYLRLPQSRDVSSKISIYRASRGQCDSLQVTEVLRDWTGGDPPTKTSQLSYHGKVLPLAKKLAKKLA